MTANNASPRTGSRRRIAPALLVLLAVGFASGCDGLGNASEADYLERAEQRMDAGDYSAAIIEYRNALRMEDRADTRQALGMAYLANERYDAASTHLERAFRQTGSHELLLPLAQALFQLDRFPEILDLPEADGLEPAEEAEYLSYHALAHADAGQTERAREALDAAREMDAGSALIPLVQGQLAFREGDAEAARDAVQRALDADETLAPAWTLSGDLYRWQGDTDSALDAYDRALELRPQQIAERLKRGLILVEQERFDDAMEDARFLREGASGHPGGHFLMGLAHFQQEQLDEAQSYFEEALSASRNFRPAMPYLAAIHMENGRLSQAQHQLERHVATGPGSIMTYQLWARLHMERDEPEAARSRLEQALAENPEMTPALGEMLAALYLDSDQPEQGISFLRTSISEGQDSPAMRQLLARALVEHGEEAEARDLLAEDPAAERETRAMDHLARGRYGEALELAREMIEDNPDDTQGYNIQGAALLGLNRPEDARSAFRDGLQEVPDSVSLAMNLGSLELRLDNQQAAREVFEELQERMPGHPPSAMRLAQMDRAAGQTGRARERLEQALSENPDALQPALLLARMHLSEQRPADAIATLEDALEHHPDDPELLFAAAEVHERMGQPGSALPHLQHLVDLRPDEPEFHYRLARVVAATDDLDASMAALREVLDLDPDHAGARQALSHQLADTGELAEAREVLAPLLEADDITPDLIARDARLLAREGEHRAAAERYTEALEKARNRQWLAERHQARMRGGMLEESLDDLQEWLDEFPEDLGARHLIGSVQVSLGRDDEARATYRTVLAQREDDVVALNNLAWLLREDATDEAMGYAQRARELAPDDPAVLDTLGVVLFYSGDNDAAREVLEDAYSDAASTPAIGYHLARVLETEGDQDGARSLLEAVLEQGGDFPERSEAAALLDDLS